MTKGRCSERCGNDIIGFHRDKAELIHKSSPQPKDSLVDSMIRALEINFHSISCKVDRWTKLMQFVSQFTHTCKVYVLNEI